MDHPDRPLLCEACRKLLNGPTQMEDHVRGKSHKKQGGSFIYTALGMDVREVLMSLVEAGVLSTCLAE